MSFQHVCPIYVRQIGSPRGVSFFFVSCSAGRDRMSRALHRPDVPDPRLLCSRRPASTSEMPASSAEVFQGSKGCALQLDRPMSMSIVVFGQQR